MPGLATLNRELSSCDTIRVFMRIAFDTGGTFTDCVFQRGGRLEILKIPSTPHQPEEAISQALSRISRLDGADRHLDLVCGTTVGTNALLERRGGCVALVTTAGFEDVLEIGRQARTRLYDLMVKRIAPLVPKERRYGLRERLDSDGLALLTPSDAEIARVVSAVVRSGANSVAVCLLFSFVHPAHERTIARALRSAGLQVSASHQILPEYREFERTSTTVVNAYLVPVMSDYLAGIEHIAKAYTAIEPIVPETKILWGRRPAGGFLVLPPDRIPLAGRRRHKESARSRPNPSHSRVRVMQSNGGILSASAAAREPVRTILSGPAGGVLGAQYVAATAGLNRIITFDMGGTSTDVALMQSGSADALATTRETIVSELPVAVPMLDIHTVGAGGGSIARFDRAGALRVGPESAGADPGPICYGRGNRPTVTDANLALGRIPESGLLGGEFKLDIHRARHYMDRVLASMPSLVRARIRSTDAFAQGILDVANAVMEKAIRVISVERGHDPRDYTLVAFGGAGALHACDLAAGLEIPRVLVPCFSGSALRLGHSACRRDEGFVAHNSVGIAKCVGNASEARSGICKIKTRRPQTNARRRICRARGPSRPLARHAIFRAVVRVGCAVQGRLRLRVPSRA